MIDDLLREVEEAIMALKLAGADVPSYQILEDGAVYFDFRKEEGNTTVPGKESRG